MWDWLHRLIGIEHDFDDTADAEVARALCVEARREALREAAACRTRRIERFKSGIDRHKARADRLIRKLPDMVLATLREDKVATFVVVYVSRADLTRGREPRAGTYTAYLAERLKAAGFRLSYDEDLMRRRGIMKVFLPHDPDPAVLRQIEAQVD